MKKTGHSFMTCEGTLITDCSECTLNPQGKNHVDGEPICEQAGLFQLLAGVRLRVPGVCGCQYGWLPEGLRTRTWKEYIRDKGIEFGAEHGLHKLPPPDFLEELLEIKRKSEEEIF